VKAVANPFNSPVKEKASTGKLKTGTRPTGVGKLGSVEKIDGDQVFPNTTTKRTSPNQGRSVTNLRYLQKGRTPSPKGDV